MTRRVEDFSEFMRDVVNLNPARYERLKRSDKAVTEHLQANLGGFISTERQGSYALGTTIRPVKDNDGYDVDRLVNMVYDDSRTPEQYIDEVYRCLKMNGNYADKVHRNTRCVTVKYAGEFSIDIVPSVTVGDQHYICNRKTNQYEPTDGSGFRDWFNDKNRITNGNLKLVTRLLKYLRDHKDTFTAPSILLTTLIGNMVYDWEDDANFKTLPEALLTVISRMNEFLQSYQFMPDITNPALPSESFTRHWDQDIYSHFREMISSYARRINEAVSEEDEQTSIRRWRNLFGDKFGHLSGMASTAGVTTAPRVIKPSKPYAAVTDRHMQSRLRLGRTDLAWLAASFPQLRCELDAGLMVGQMELSAAYDRDLEKLHIGGDDVTRSMGTYLRDTFTIRVELNNPDLNGLPKVYETGGRHEQIAARENVPPADLHLYPDGACCLGLQALADRQISLQEFMDERVLPFFYRLSYVDKHGWALARKGLWDEYSHGDHGIDEYLADVAKVAGVDLGRNDQCACGSGRKYKQCHLGEVTRLKSAQRQSL